jgi:hypothetical protein
MLPTTTSKVTPVVSLTPRNVDTTSTMPSPLLVTDLKMDKNMPSSETPGLPPGEKKDTSECPSMSPEPVSADFSWTTTLSRPIELKIYLI